MNIDRFKAHHTQILEGIATLRKLTREGVEDRAVDIAHELKQLSGVVTQHLAIEDRILYPSLEQSGDDHIAQMSRRYEAGMKDIATSFILFAKRWSNATALTKTPQRFRDEANTVLKRVFDRMQQENREFYPAIETLEAQMA